MRLPTLRRSRTAEAGDVTGPARLDRRTKRLIGRLRPGDIAIIDHLDLDRVAADMLVAAGVSAVVNARPSISGRYPNLGPDVLVRAGIPLVDDVGEDIFHAVRDGATVRIDGGTVFVGEAKVGTGARQDTETVAAAMADAREGLSAQLEAFAGNTMEYLRTERDLLLDGVGMPEVRTPLAGRHCLVVVRGYDFRADLAALRAYIREFRPALIGVDGGADALAEAGYRPDIIIGDLDEVSDTVLRCGAEVIVHEDADGRTPGLARVERLGVPAAVFRAAATSEDLAMLLADEKGSPLIVAVGTHATLTEFLDKGRGGMASTFLTRLKLGSKLIDAKAARRLYRQTISTSSLLLLMLAAMAALAAAFALATVGHPVLARLADWWGNVLSLVQGLVS